MRQISALAEQCEDSPTCCNRRGCCCSRGFSSVQPQGQPACYEHGFVKRKALWSNRSRADKKILAGHCCPLRFDGPYPASPDGCPKTYLQGSTAQTGESYKVPLLTEVTRCLSSRSCVFTDAFMIYIQATNPFNRSRWRWIALGCYRLHQIPFSPPRLS